MTSTLTPTSSSKSSALKSLLGIPPSSPSTTTSPSSLKKDKYQANTSTPTPQKNKPQNTARHPPGFLSDKSNNNKSNDNTNANKADSNEKNGRNERKNKNDKRPIIGNVTSNSSGSSPTAKAVAPVKTPPAKSVVNAVVNGGERVSIDSPSKNTRSKKRNNVKNRDNINSDPRKPDDTNNPSSSSSSSSSLKTNNNNGRNNSNKNTKNSWNNNNSKINSTDTTAKQEYEEAIYNKGEWNSSSSQQQDRQSANDILNVNTDVPFEVLCTKGDATLIIYSNSESDTEYIFPSKLFTLNKLNALPPAQPSISTPSSISSPLHVSKKPNEQSPRPPPPTQSNLPPLPFQLNENETTERIEEVMPDPVDMTVNGVFTSLNGSSNVMGSGMGGYGGGGDSGSDSSDANGDFSANTDTAASPTITPISTSISGDKNLPKKRIRVKKKDRVPSIDLTHTDDVPWPDLETKVYQAKTRNADFTDGDAALSVTDAAGVAEENASSSSTSNSSWFNVNSIFGRSAPIPPSTKPKPKTETEPKTRTTKVVSFTTIAVITFERTLSSYVIPSSSSWALGLGLINPGKYGDCLDSHDGGSDSNTSAVNSVTANGEVKNGDNDLIGLTDVLGNRGVIERCKGDLDTFERRKQIELRNRSKGKDKGKDKEKDKGKDKEKDKGKDKEKDKGGGEDEIYETRQYDYKKSKNPLWERTQEVDRKALLLSALVERKERDDADSVIASLKHDEMLKTMDSLERDFYERRVKSESKKKEKLVLSEKRDRSNSNSSNPEMSKRDRANSTESNNNNTGLGHNPTPNSLLTSYAEKLRMKQNGIKFDRNVKGGIGCDCHRVVSRNINKYKDQKLRDELKRRGVDVNSYEGLGNSNHNPQHIESSVKEEMLAKLKELCSGEKCCQFDCPCAAEEVECHADLCGCYQVSSNGKDDNVSANNKNSTNGNSENVNTGEQCGNKNGVYKVDVTSIRAHRKGWMQRLSGGGGLCVDAKE